jgi:chromosome segregation ATPase
MSIDSPKKDNAGKDNAGKDKEHKDAGGSGVPAVELLTSDTKYEQLIKLASPADRAVLEGLSLQLGVAGSQRGQQAKARAAELMKEKKELDAKYKRKSAEFSAAASKIRKTLTNRWPELNNRWHPRTVELLAKESEALVALIESHPEFKKLDKLEEEVKELSDQRLDLDRQWAKCQRLIRTLENVALAANLPHVAATDAQERYRTLLAAESGTFGPQKPSSAPAPAPGN